MNREHRMNVELKISEVKSFTLYNKVQKHYADQMGHQRLQKVCIISSGALKDNISNGGLPSLADLKKEQIINFWEKKNKTVMNI